MVSKAVILGFTAKKHSLSPTAEGKVSPRPVATLLKINRKKYGNKDGVVKDINALINGDGESISLVGRILSLRNRAAYANVAGGHQ